MTWPNPLSAIKISESEERPVRVGRSQASLENLSMRTFLPVGLTAVLALAAAGIVLAQENPPQPQRPNQAHSGIHGPRSIDQELDHLTKDLELTTKQRKQILPVLEDHHDRIQALFDKNPDVSRADLGPQIHAISDETHHQIEALLTEHQRQLAKAMQRRMHDREESRPSTPPSASK